MLHGLASSAPCYADQPVWQAHSKHSYLGFCCLMQLSTRTEDYLIDCIALRSSMHLLNVIFTNQAITKVRTYSAAAYILTCCVHTHLLRCM